MIRFVARRLLMIVPIVLMASIAVFVLTAVAPGDAARQRAGGVDASAESIKIAEHQLGLDRPLVEQYLTWAGDAIRGDLGESFVRPDSVTSMVAERIPVTMSIAIGATVIGILIALVAGLLAASRPDGKLDRAVTAGASLGVATPDFFMALILVLLFAVTVPVFPAIGYEPLSAGVDLWASHLILPWIVLGTSLAAPLARHLRAAMRDVLGQQYIVTAIAMGMPRRTILLKYALKNASMPVVTVIGLQFSRLIGGTVVIETVFVMRGVGDLAVSAVLNKDFPVIQGVAIFSVAAVIVVNLLVDLTYMFLNPKVRMA